MDWDGADAHLSAVIVSMVLDGASMASIAKRIGVSRNAVIGRTHRLRERGILPPVNPSVATAKLRVAKQRVKPHWPDMDREARLEMGRRWERDGYTARRAAAEVSGATPDQVRGYLSDNGIRLQSGLARHDNANVFDLNKIRIQRAREEEIESEVAITPAPDASTRVTLLELENHHCRYSVEDGFFCGGPADVIGGRSWCEHHARVVFSGRQAMQEGDDLEKEIAE
jgi:hypothetical protein